MIDQIYTSINTMPIWNYKRIEETGDLRYLIISEDYGFEFKEAERHINTWSNICNQYIEKTNTRFENRRFADLKRQILQLTIKYNSVNAYCFLLSQVWDEEIVKELNKLGFYPNQISDLLEIVKKAKNIKTQLREREIELKTEFVQEKEQISFEQLLDRISDHKKRTLDPRKISVIEWIAIEDNYIKDIKNAANKNIRR